MTKKSQALRPRQTSLLQRPQKLVDELRGLPRARRRNAPTRGQSHRSAPVVREWRQALRGWDEGVAAESWVVALADFVVICAVK